jgi:hypothetical protein
MVTNGFLAGIIHCELTGFRLQALDGDGGDFRVGDALFFEEFLNLFRVGF